MTPLAGVLERPPSGPSPQPGDFEIPEFDPDLFLPEDAQEAEKYRAALEYLERGYQLVLVYGTEEGVCSCFKGQSCGHAGKHPIGRGWTGKPIRSKSELATAWRDRGGRPTNIGSLLFDKLRLLLIDEDNKKGKKGSETIKEWESTLGFPLSPYQVQATPTNGKHYLFRVPAEYPMEALPNDEVADGVDVFHTGRQFVLAPSSTPVGIYIPTSSEDPVSLPHLDRVPEAPRELLDHLAQMGGGTRPERAPTSPEELQALRAPSIQQLTEVVRWIPNGEEVKRSKYVWMAHAIKGAAGPEHVGDGCTLFLGWASGYPGADLKEDAATYDKIRWAKVSTGWPDLWRLAAKHGYDASDERLAEAQAQFDVEPGPGPPEGPNRADGVPVSVALFRTILNHPDIRVFHARHGGRPFVQIKFRGVWQTHPLDGESGPRLLRHVLNSWDRPPSTNAFSEAVELLRGHARFEASAEDVYVRVAHLEDRVYIDLGDESYRVIQVTRDGWKVEDNPGIAFVRTGSTRPLPEPKGGGAPEDFGPFFPTESKSDLRLLLTFLVDTFLAPQRAARPLLIFEGPPGSAKSTMTAFAKELTDPEVGGLFAPSKSELDLVIAARSSHVVAFDNASVVPPTMSDALCRLTTGGALRTRKLYTDDGEVVFDELRHVILNSIGDVAGQNDLRSRCLFVSARSITHRRDDAEIWEEFEEVKPTLFGVLLGAVAAALAEGDQPTISDTEFPRMAGFAKRGAACSEALGWSAVEFLDAYRANIDQAAADYLEEDLVAAAILRETWIGARSWLETRFRGKGIGEAQLSTWRRSWPEDAVWYGPASDLKAYLESKANFDLTKKQAWPRDNRWFGRKLNMADEPLRQAGWKLEEHRPGGARMKVIRRIRRWDRDPPDLDRKDGQPPRNGGILG